MAASTPSPTPGLTKLVFSLRHTFESDEKATAIRHPLRQGMRQFFANWQIHEKIINKRKNIKKSGNDFSDCRAQTFRQDLCERRRGTPERVGWQANGVQRTARPTSHVFILRKANSWPLFYATPFSKTSNLAMELEKPRMETMETDEHG